MLRIIFIQQLKNIQIQNIIKNKTMRVTNQPINSKLFPQVNTIAKNKKPNQSDFRVHFTLMNVKWKNKDQAKLIDYVLSVIGNICRVQIGQISTVIEDDIFDITIGLYNDIEAFQFLRKKPIIKLSDGSKQYEYQPRVSRVFQSYIKKMDKNYEQRQPNISSGNLISSTQYIINTNTQNKKQEKQQIGGKNPQTDIKQNLVQLIMQNKYSLEDQSKYDKKMSKDIKDKEVNKLWAFGIPKQFQIPEIKNSLKNYGILSGECRWKNKQHMEFLQIDLLQPLSKGTVYYLGLQIEGYPYVPIPITQQSQITRQLARYTVQIIIKTSNDDEDKLMYLMYQIGGVNVMLRTPLRQKEDYRYIIVFNNVDNAQKACRAVKDIRDCTAQRKQYQLRLGRVNKYYTFTELSRQMYM